MRIRRSLADSTLGEEDRLSPIGREKAKAGSLSVHRARFGTTFAGAAKNRLSAGVVTRLNQSDCTLQRISTCRGL